MENKTKKLLKRLTSLFLCILCVCISSFLFSCEGKEHDERPKIVCTTFVLADWTRAVLGDDCESFSVELLGANGADIHSYQPTVADISLLSRCDVFIHIGGESDEWVEDVLYAAQNESLTRLDLSSAMEDELCTDGGDGHSHEGHTHEGEHHFDEHIWFSFEHTRTAVSEIARTLGERYPDKKEAYENNAAEYLFELSALEAEYKVAADTAEVRHVLIADRHPFEYLFDSLGIEAHAAFSGCSAESEASFEVMARLVGVVDEHSLSYIIKCEDSDGSIAEAVKNNARTKGIEILTLNSLQSLGKSELDAGVSYLSVMRENLAVIKTAISK